MSETQTSNMANTADANQDIEQVSKTVMLRMGATLIGLVLAAVAAFYFVFQFGEDERQRELRGWQSRMGIIADSRHSEVTRWLNSQRQDLRNLADNASLQLYMTLLHGEEGDEVDAELEYLGNLLTVTAERAGYVEDRSYRSEVAANVARQGTVGIALLDAEGQLVISTSGFPPVAGELKQFLAMTPPGEGGYSKAFLNSESDVAMAFAEPVYSLQGDRTAASYIGTIIGVKPVMNEVAPLLVQPGLGDGAGEAILVRRNGAAVEYLTELKDGTAPLRKKLDLKTAELAAAAMLDEPTSFGIYKDYNGKEVLTVARVLDEVPWLLVYNVDRNKALADSDSRVNMMVLVLGLVIILVIIGMLTLWYFGTSKRAKEAADKFEQLAARFEGQRNFMHLVTDSQPNRIVIFDIKGNYRWFNDKTVKASGISRGDLFQKNVSAVHGPSEGKIITNWVRKCLEDNEIMVRTHEMRIDDMGNSSVFRSEFIPIPARDDLPAGVLMVSQDISDSVREKEKRERSMRQLVSTLVSLVDRRDPFAIHHSKRVTEVSREIAAEMDLEPSVAETAAIAGSLMNLGKIEVPTSILTKQGALSDAERKLIQESIISSADMVEGIDFDGPVRETMRQLLEHLDGSGYPGRAKGEEILVPARVASVANVFVGMVSARAWRDGMPFDKAARILFEESGSKFDQAAVAALINILNNRNGREKWKSYGVPPEGDS